ncbi:uncharacterized protein F4812DRAFT_428123 [Daldinia caldariorum]|uniref:uncharacterized protein n=1 Tax=Daldinia caldariorum TaxID=326644 RepID=UPI002008A37C|nr:uncharacterized protein F4812DRAFT_428123 [Daldinia caldariorum]KAI1467925.1 hypothetical protein F4812DRAFT_428123 [Daldinia caldariorum]
MKGIVTLLLFGLAAAAPVNQESQNQLPGKDAEAHPHPTGLPTVSFSLPPLPTSWPFPPLPTGSGFPGLPRPTSRPQPTGRPKPTSRPHPTGRPGRPTTTSPLPTPTPTA